MRLRLASVLLLAACAAAGTEQRILVGSDDPASDGVALNPAHANLSVGDTLAFTFWRPGTNLSIIQSSRERACAPLAGGFDSGWIQSSEDNIIVYRMFLTNLEPLFYYALNGSATVSQPQKCAEGMFGSVNASPAQIEAYKTLAVGVTAFPVVKSSASGTGVTPSSTGSPSPSSTNTPGAVKDDSDGKGKNKDEDEDGKGGLSTGTISAIAICAVLVAGAVFWFVRRRKTRQRRPAERRPPRDPPPAYVAVQPQPASISAASGMTEVWEEVGGRTIMRAPSLSMTSHPGTHSAAGSSSQTASSNTSTGSATLDTNPFASPEDEDDETATLRSSSRPTSPSASAEEEDAPPEYMSSHSVPPPFSAVARR